MLIKAHSSQRILTTGCSGRWMFEDGKNVLLIKQNVVKDICEKLTLLINNNNFQEELCVYLKILHQDSMQKK